MGLVLMGLVSIGGVPVINAIATRWIGLLRLDAHTSIQPLVFS
jgi:hypothetical protein